MRRAELNGVGSAVWHIVGLFLGMCAAAATAGPVANLSRTSVAFYNTPALAYIVQPVFVTNTGDAPLHITAISLSGANAAEFILGGTCGATITLPVFGGRCRIDIAANLVLSGPANRVATLTLQSDATPAAAPVSISAVVDNGAAPSSLLSPPWIDFPAQPVGTSAVPQTFIFSNPFTDPQVIDRAFFSLGDGSDFSLTTNCTTVPPSASCMLSIGFAPTATGPRSTELELDFHNPNEPNNPERMHRYSVTGVGGVAGPAALDLDQHGLTGSWYDAATSGQGLEVEIYPDLSPGSGFAQVSWFTFDTAAGGADHERWYTLSGTATSGEPSAALTIYQNTGGNFNALPTTTAQAVGTATLSFATCTTGQLAYNFTDGSGRMGSIPLTRLTQNVTCATTAPPFSTNTDFAHSGNWYDATTAGQGFTVEVNPISGALFVAWYTYAPMGAAAGAAGQRWYTAQATFAAGMRSIPVTIYETTGGIFNMPTPAGQQTVAVGTGTLAFQSCTAATFGYDFTGGSSSGLSGAINLSRVGPVPPGCTS